MNTAQKSPGILQKLLEANQWDLFQPRMDTLAQWAFWPDFLSAVQNLKREALYQSPVHGLGHIERTLLHGAFCAMEEGLPREDTLLLLDACSYHDVGRINDWLDPLHGNRSAQRLAELTGRSGEALVMLMAAVDAHSRKDQELEGTIQSYHPSDYPRTLRLAKLLKDADGLDRVRIHDLNTDYLRYATSVQRADFALYLFGRYQMYTALEQPFLHHRSLGMQLERLAPKV